MEMLHVTWIDSESHVDERGSTGGVWVEKDQLVKELEEVSLCTTIGFVIAENEVWLQLANSIANGDVGGDLRIPKAAIQTRVELKMPRKRRKKSGPMPSVEKI